LIVLKSKGFRSILLYIVQRQDVTSVRAAEAIDPAYARLLKEAHLAGVEVLAYQGDMDLSGIRFGRSLPVTLA
jgi:sugar fermentation stimulation protein A